MILKASVIPVNLAPCRNDQMFLLAASPAKRIREFELVGTGSPILSKTSEKHEMKKMLLNTFDPD